MYVYNTTIKAMDVRYQLIYMLQDGAFIDGVFKGTKD